MIQNVDPLPPSQTLERPAILRIMAGVLTAMLLGAMDQTIVAPALATIGREFGSFEYLPWVVTAYLLSATAVLPLRGVYKETSASAEFLTAEDGLPIFEFGGRRPLRPHWPSAFEVAGEPCAWGPAVAEAFGARWYVECDDERSVVVAELDPVPAVGVTIAPQASEESWHRAAVNWWIDRVGDTDAPGETEPRDEIQWAPLPILAEGVAVEHPDRAAEVVSLTSGPDSLTAVARFAGVGLDSRFVGS